MISRLLSDPHIFPKVIICLYVCASLRYAYDKDYGRVLYWISAACITISTTLLRFK